MTLLDRIFNGDADLITTANHNRDDLDGLIKYLIHYSKKDFNEVTSYDTHFLEEVRHV